LSSNKQTHLCFVSTTPTTDHDDCLCSDHDHDAYPNECLLSTSSPYHSSTSFNDDKTERVDRKIAKMQRSAVGESTLPLSSSLPLQMIDDVSSISSSSSQHLSNVINSLPDSASATVSGVSGLANTAPTDDSTTVVSTDVVPAITPTSIPSSSLPTNQSSDGIDSCSVTQLGMNQCKQTICNIQESRLVSLCCW
jgi:hypothetical protein